MSSKMEDIVLTGRTLHSTVVRTTLIQTTNETILMTVIPPIEIDDLRKRIRGTVHNDAVTRISYSVDASIFSEEPSVIVAPRSHEDVMEVVNFAASRSIPVTARGAGTGVTGGCLGTGIIIDFSRHMNRILEVNLNEEYAIVEPGVVQDELNKRLAPDGYRLGPDTSTGNRATLGGMLGNNASGAHSLRFGRTVDSIIELDLVLANSDVLTVGPTTNDPRITKMHSIIKDLAPEIRSRYPAIQRNVAGYGLDQLLDEDANPAKLFCGAEGTLGICTRLKVAIKSRPQRVGLVVFHFNAMPDGLESVPDLLSSDPYALELIDGKLIERGRANPSFTGKLQWLDGSPDGILVIEFDADDDDQLTEKLQACMNTHSKVGYARVPITEPSAMAEVWALRKAGLGLLMGRRSPDRALAFVEDVAIPPSALGSFVPWVREFFAENGIEAGFFGHAGVGLVHIRPTIDLANDDQPMVMLSIMRAVMERVLELGGTPSGEHGDGYIRSWLLGRLYGRPLTDGFRAIKKIFDPQGIMNPGKIVDAKFPADLIRPSLTERPQTVETAFTFRDEGGLAFAAAMCNGNAACRSYDGAMCPSFQATGDEIHTTRARATTVQKAFATNDPLAALASDEVKDVMSLCLQCKACASECPSLVDVAKMKSEALHQRNLRNGTPLRSRLFASVDTAGKMASRAPRLANRLMASWPVKSLLAAIGITKRRPPMAYAPQRFTHWYAEHAPKNGDGDKIALFVDTFSEFNYPNIPKAAMLVLSAMNCQITVPPYTCCGRPAISKGLLDKAKRKAMAIREIYGPLVRDGYRIVGLEPGCILTFRDEHPGLLGYDDEAKRIADASTTIEEYLHERMQAGTMTMAWAETPTNVLVHCHCHQKSLVGVSPALAVLRAIPGFSVSEIDSGCCGMAGTFGYETENYDLSMAIGERALFPAVRNTTGDTLIVASGASCRSQISHGTGRDGYHFIEAVAAGLAKL